MPRKKKVKKEKVFHAEYRHDGWDTTCFLCGRVILRKLDEGDEDKETNFPVETRDIPGYVHRRCRGMMNKKFIENPVHTKDVTGYIG